MSTDPLLSLISTFVPETRTDENLRREIAEQCQEILSSHIGHNNDHDIGHLADLVKRHLAQTSRTGVTSMRFTNLLSRLLDQPVLSRTHASVRFLYALGSTPHQSSIAPTFLPSLAPPAPPPRPITPIPPEKPHQHNKPVGKSKSALLKEYRSKIGRPHLPEHLLLRDTLYLLQGISGKYIQLSRSENSDESNLVFIDDPTHIIDSPTRTLIHRLAEAGHLYIRVENYVREREGRSGVGMIEQSLCHHVQSQLTEYYRLVAVLESQLTVPPVGKDGVKGIPGEETGLTLKRLDVWINEWRLRMRMMSVCVEAALDAHGGALVNLIHGYTDNGDPFVRKFTDQLLEEVSKPFFVTLHKWLFSGELYDPYEEFFVSVDSSLANMHHTPALGGIGQDGGFGGSLDNEDISGDRETGLKLWEDKYQFEQDMLPAFVGEAFGRKIFSTGKSLNFIRYSCHDSDWVATREKMSNTGGALQYSDIAGLERSIDAAYQTASERLFEVFVEKFRLLDHLLALKHYLLLGYGDFADQLMETLGPSLMRPANTLYRHNLTATLETAIRSSNAQNDSPDVLRRLDARMMEYSHGEIGWDVFSLEYKVNAPIDTVLDPASMEKYLKLFNYLWKLKRVEGALSASWMQIQSGTRTFFHVPELQHDWHQIRIVMAEMIHFVRNIQAYCQLEVIECSWKVLLDFINKKEGDLDAMIGAHRTYLDRMVKKVLMLSSKAGREESLLNQTRELFATILHFREATDNFYNYCLSESARRDHHRDADRGVYTGAPIKEPTSDNLPRIQRRVQEYGSSFSERAQAIVHSLQGHSDLDCRFLGVRLSFSDYYKSKKEMQQQQQQQSQRG